MTCQNCGSETNAIRINGKFFCPNCGEQMETPPAPVMAEPEAKEGTPTPKYIPKEEIEEEIDELGVELNVLNMIEEEAVSLEQESKLEAMKVGEKVIESIPVPKVEKSKKKKKKKGEEPKIKDKKIVKHNRKRVEHKKEKEFLVIPGEPDPVKVPELEFPKEDQLTEPIQEMAAPTKDFEVDLRGKEEDAEKVISFPLLDQEKEEEFHERAENRKKVFASFMKAGASQVKKKKAPKKVNKKALFIILGILGFLALATGLVLYVNLYATKPAISVEKAEREASFSYAKPSYIPPGYDLSYETKGTDTEISYVYKYLPDPTKEITINIKKSTITEEEVLKDYVKKGGVSYIESSGDAGKVWLVEEEKAYLVKEGAFYEITSSFKIGDEVLLKIAEGLNS